MDERQEILVAEAAAATRRCDEAEAAYHQASEEWTDSIAAKQVAWSALGDYQKELVAAALAGEK